MFRRICLLQVLNFLIITIKIDKIVAPVGLPLKTIVTATAMFVLGYRTLKSFRGKKKTSHNDTGSPIQIRRYPTCMYFMYPTRNEQLAFEGEIK